MQVRSEALLERSVLSSDVKVRFFHFKNRQISRGHFQVHKILFAQKTPKFKELKLNFTGSFAFAMRAEKRARRQFSLCEGKFSFLFK